MSLRIVAPPKFIPESTLENETAHNQKDPPQPDGWASRLAKLIPAEALGLYGAAAGLIPQVSGEFSESDRLLCLRLIAGFCLVFSGLIRAKATSKDGKPQIWAIAVALISFMIWMVTLGRPNAPLVLPQGFSFAPPVIALLWATAISYFYKGDPEKGG